MALTAAISTISGMFVFLALSFALAVAACLSLALFMLSTPKPGSVTADPPVLRLMKREVASVHISLGRRRSQWQTLAAASVPSLPGLVLESSGSGTGAFTIRASHAGRYEALTIDATLTDALGLFTRSMNVGPERFVVEVLPLSLLLAPVRPAFASTAWGETPAGARGAGQEFYGVEEYSSGIESKDILWKRVAKDSEQRIIARVRESNIPKELKVALVRGTGTDSTGWMDAVSEILGRVGRSVIALGMGLEVTFAAEGGERSFRSSTTEELAETLIEIWRFPALSGSLGPSAPSADLMVAGSGACEGASLAELSGRISTLVVEDGGPPTALGARARMVARADDVGDLMQAVVVG